MEHPPPLLNAVYYPSWRVYKDIPPSSLPVDKISTIFYAFAIPNEDGTLKFLDEYADAQIAVDGENGCLNALAKLKRDHGHLRTVLSIGGGSGSGAFAQLAASPASRTTFAKSAAEWVNKYSFDGIDIDWEHPKTTSEGEQFILLLQACRSVLPAPRYLLATALPIDPSVLGMINMNNVAAIVDHVNLMCYDFSGPWSEVAGHQAQLYSASEAASATGHRILKEPRNKHPQLNISCQTGLRYLLARGVPAQKILLGVPAYARCFPGARSLGERFRVKDGEEVEMDYRDVPLEWKQAAEIEPGLAAASYVDKEKGLVSFDVPSTVHTKAVFARSSGLGGLFFWTGAGDGTGRDSLVVAGFDGLHSF